MNTCRTSVPTGLQTPMFRACGRPATSGLMYGVKWCEFCVEHADQARQAIEKMGDQQGVLAIQRQTLPERF